MWKNGGGVKKDSKWSNEKLNAIIKRKRVVIANIWLLMVKEHGRKTTRPNEVKTKGKLKVNSLNN